MRNWWSELTENDAGFTLVELMIVVAIIGILAAIAIPQFMQSVQNAKTAEVEQIMSKMADGSVGYFTSEQRGSTTDGDEPWHNSITPGDPVGFNSKVYPGGAQCDLPDNPTTIPTAGGKQDPDASSSYSGCQDAIVRYHGLELEDPLYFQYDYTSSGNGTDAIATITAQADFDPNASDDETHIQTLSVDDSGKPQKGSAYAENVGE